MKRNDPNSLVGLVKARRSIVERLLRKSIAQPEEWFGLDDLTEVEFRVLERSPLAPRPFYRSEGELLRDLIVKRAETLVEPLIISELIIKREGEKSLYQIPADCAGQIERDYLSFSVEVEAILDAVELRNLGGQRWITTLLHVEEATGIPFYRIREIEQENCLILPIEREATMEKRRKQMLKLKEEGLGIEAIAKAMEIRESTVKVYASRFGLLLPRDTFTKREETDHGDGRKQNKRARTAELLKRGMRVEEIAQELALSVSTVRLYASGEGSSLRRQEEPMLKRVRALYDQNILTIPEMALFLKIAERNVDRYFWKSGLKHQDRVAHEIALTIARGTRDLDELCERVGLGAAGVKRYCKQYGIELPCQTTITPHGSNMIVTRELALKGLTLEEIGDVLDLSRERIRQHVNELGIHEEWRAARAQRKVRVKKEYEVLETGRERLVTVLDLRMQQLAEQAGWATQKALEAVRSLSYTTHSISDYIGLFNAYQKAKESGRRTSLEELGKPYGLRASSVGRILERVGAEPLTWKSRTHNRCVSSKIYQAIERGVRLHLRISDLAYFLDLDLNNIAARIAAREMYRSPEKEGISVEGRRGTRRVSLKYVSLVYEAADCGFNETEIDELLNYERKKVLLRSQISFLLTQRGSVEKRVISTLKELYDEPEVHCCYQKWSGPQKREE